MGAHVRHYLYEFSQERSQRIAGERLCAVHLVDEVQGSYSLHRLRQEVLLLEQYGLQGEERRVP